MEAVSELADDASPAPTVQDSSNRQRADQEKTNSHELGVESHDGRFRNGEDQLKTPQEGQNGEEEEEGECGFCLFMKSGPCRDSFIKWEECVEEGEKAKEDIVGKCHQITFLLKECMESNAGYYEPVLQAEKEMMEEATSVQDADTNTDTGAPDGVNGLPSSERNLENSGAHDEGSLPKQPIEPQNSEKAFKPSQ